MFRGLYGQASRSAYRHNSAWPTLPYRSTFAILKTAKHHGNKKRRGSKVSPRLSLTSGSRIAPT